MEKETLKEAAQRYTEEHKWEEQDPWLDFIEGAKWMQERMYSEEDLKESWYSGMKSDNGFFGSFEDWFEQFKKK